MTKIKKIIFFVLLSIAFLEKVNAAISDSLFMTIGDRAITQSDVLNEIKIILILNNESYSIENKEKLQKAAINSIIKRNMKQIEVDRMKEVKPIQYKQSIPPKIMLNQSLLGSLARRAIALLIKLPFVARVVGKNNNDFLYGKTKIELTV